MASAVVARWSGTANGDPRGDAGRRGWSVEVLAALRANMKLRAGSWPARCRVDLGAKGPLEKLIALGFHRVEPLCPQDLEDFLAPESF